MRRLTAAFLFLPIAGVAPPAHAQSRAKAERAWFSVSGGIQPAPGSFDDAFDLTLYTEKEHIAVDYPSKSGVLIAASGGYRLWKQLSIGLGVTRSSSSGSAKVNAQLPHPFFDNTLRNIEGTAHTTRAETGAHLLIGTMLPLAKRFRVLLTAGPSVLNVEQRIITDVTFSETYPYDTAAFTGVKTSNSPPRTAAGFNAGADLSWMFSKTIGAGALVQVTHARVKANAGAGRSVSFDAGGVQAGAGLRLVF